VAKNLAPVVAESNRNLAPIGAKTGPSPGLVLPESEAQCRPLSKLASADDRRAAWQEAVTRSGGGQPTASVVAETAHSYRMRPPRRPPGIALHADSGQDAEDGKVQRLLLDAEDWDALPAEGMPRMALKLHVASPECEARLSGAHRNMGIALLELRKIGRG
jgi:hypothetical protein